MVFKSTLEASLTNADIGQNQELSGALEDYLETIYLLMRDKKVARVRDIAKARKVRPVSVTQAMHRLAELGLIDYAQRERIELTSEGERRALRVFSRHRVLTKFFDQILGVDPNQAESTACAMEHQLGDQAMDALVRFFEFLQVCPEGRSFLTQFHGCSRVHPEQPPCAHHCERGQTLAEAQPFQRSQGVAPQDIENDATTAIAEPSEEPRGHGLGLGFGRPAGKGLRRGGGKGLRRGAGRGHNLDSGGVGPAVPPLGPTCSLADLGVGQKARVTQIHGRGAVRQRLLDMGLLPNERLEIERVALAHGPVWIKLNGYQLALRRGEARAVDVEILE